MGGSGGVAPRKNFLAYAFSFLRKIFCAKFSLICDNIFMAYDPAITAAASALGRKGGLKRNPNKGFGSSPRRASEAARRRWELYKLRKGKAK